MHGEWWLLLLLLLISLLPIAIHLLYRALRTKKHHRYHQLGEHNDIQRVFLGRNIINTSTG